MLGAVTIAVAASASIRPMPTSLCVRFGVSNGPIMPMEASTS